MLNKGLFAQHGKALLEIGVVSAFGVFATAGFQIVASRGLGPSGFGLLASFLAIINVAAVGSAALRSSIAVVTSEGVALGAVAPQARRRLDASMVEALILGGLCTVALLAASPWLTTSLETNSLALILTAATVLPYFLFSRAQGLLQGTGDSRSVVLWTSGSQIAQLALTVIALAMGLGAVGILSVILLIAVLGTVGSSYQARRFTVPASRRPFSVDSSVVLLLTISFAWLTNADVILVRSGTSELVAGSFAAAAVLVKTTLILPATLSLYLLPRFVSRREDASMTKLGVNVTLALTFLSGVAMFLLVLVAGEPLVGILFGAGYELAVAYLPWLALMWLPWAMALAVLVRVTAAASKAGLIVLLVAAVAQWVGATSLLPSVPAMMIFNGSLGALTLAALFLIHLARTRPEIRGI
ncbi:MULTISPECIES: hypothetical protein [Cryobacterium]|uniref:Polysaccharide biosynthesis protein n=1 Tax=Cryobacterium breve TaxID=1259258 RepID=A0ABY2JA51_9MICO|nr:MULTISPECIES: hypothetical protein [Cryobacterium]TFC90413.1 hypothetical protein E3T20_16370 [Cryobacterium sp. TmT3-12]TFD01830.1 hypothetical protein E3O65_00565 [Cryobacterium breve]